jgi:hypothetical protein
MEIEIKKYLFDIQEASRLIIEFTAGQEFEAYQKNVMMRSAVSVSSPSIPSCINQFVNFYTFHPLPANSLTATCERAWKHD